MKYSKKIINRIIIHILLFLFPFTIVGCNSNGNDYVSDSTLTESTIAHKDESGFGNDTLTEASNVEDGIVYDPMNPEIYARNILCGNWKAFAVCKTDYDDDTGDYYYDSSICSEDDLPDLSDQIYNGVDSYSDDTTYCNQFTASIFSDQTAIIRYDGGRTFTCSYVIEQIEEDYIYCRLYEGRKAIGHFYIYQADEQIVGTRYTLKVVFYTYGGFTSMSVKVAE